MDMLDRASNLLEGKSSFFEGTPPRKSNDPTTRSTHKMRTTINNKLLFWRDTEDLISNCVRDMDFALKLWVKMKANIQQVMTTSII